MEILLNIIERTWLHFGWSPMVVILATVFHDWASRKYPWVMAQANPALLALFLIAAAEPWQIAHSQPVWWKSYIDIGQWIVFMSLFAYWRYRKYGKI